MTSLTGCNLDWSKDSESQDDSVDSGESADGGVTGTTSAGSDAGPARAADGGNGDATDGGEDGSSADAGDEAADGGDEGAPDSGSEPGCSSIINACGGCGALSGDRPLNGTCGTCGTYVCSSDKLHVVCDDPGETNSCPTWCTGQAAPSGVLAADFQCVDFDRGMPDAKTWKQTVSGSGVLERTGDAFSSAPYSLAANVGGSSDTATIAWTSVGATPVKTVTASVAINPSYKYNWHTSDPILVDLLCIETGSNATCLSDVRNMADPHGEPFSGGLAVYSDYSGGFLARGGCALTTSFFNDRVWNEATLEIDVDTREVTFTLNGAIVSSDSCLGYFAPDTNIKVSIGASASSSVVGWTQYIDNITVAVTR